MPSPSIDDIRAQRDLAGLQELAGRWNAALVATLNQRDEAAAPPFTESRARALLRGEKLLDEATERDFLRLMSAETAVRVALAELLAAAELERASSRSASPAPEDDGAAAQWLALIVAAFAYKADFPLYQLDPADPPAATSPAGQVLRRAAHFVRRQVQYSATERSQRGRGLGFSLAAADAAGESPIAPLPPHYRPPIPVRYPEVARETLHIDPEDVTGEGEGTPGAAISIDAADLAPRRRPSLRIDVGETRPAVTPARGRRRRRRSVGAVVGAGNSLATAVRHLFRREALTTTRLRVLVTATPEGEPLPGVQVRVSCAGIRSHVAGITDPRGRFLCELPVPRERGLTYDIDVTWPRESGGDVERKSITLNSDRTEFNLPFYRALNS